MQSTETRCLSLPVCLSLSPSISLCVFNLAIHPYISVYLSLLPLLAFA